MTVVINKAEIIEAHTVSPEGMLFYGDLETVRRDVNLLGSISIIERAWKEMQLDGVLCLDTRPVLYLKVYNRPFSPLERIRLQRLFWNQGVANILVLIDPTAVYLYSGLTRPQNGQPDESAVENTLIDKLTIARYTRQIQTLYHAIASGHYYEENRPWFNPDQTVDPLLMENLRALRNALIEGDEGLAIQDAHAFIGRMLFLCYLLDRRIVPLEEPAKGLTATMQLAQKLDHLSPGSQVEYIYKLFHDLKNRFNGNMFDQDLEAERHLIRPGHLKKLVLFLGGDEVESGQQSLGFWPFHFKMIPVETISAIYQDFLSAEDPEDQRNRGAIYTPRFLAEMVVDTAVRNDPDLLDGTFLDPACGSGIFLVILFNRLANRWSQSRTKRPNYLTKSKALQNILARQIRGVEIEETACRIACFSLYLAYLDFFDPPDIKKHVEQTGRPLPKLLDYNNSDDRPAADIPVIHCNDFFNERTLKGQVFDCIIGNPPWKGRGSKQLAQKYLQEAPRFLKDGGTGCLLLPTKILQNQTDAFQAEWLLKVSLELVLQLSDYRRLLFQNAKTPAFIARFKNTPPEPQQHRIEFTAPKFNRTGLRQGVITITPSSRTWLPLADILEATRSKTSPVVWKRRLWGTHRDQKLLDLLQSLPTLSELAGTPKESKRWIKGQGFQPYYPEKAKSNPNYPKPKTNLWDPEQPFLNTDDKIQLVVFQHDSISLETRLKKINASKNYLRRSPNKNLFKAPMVISSHGFQKIAYCNFNVLFQSTIQSIAGPKRDEKLLIFLACYLRSKLAKYFLFHTSANWGTERNKVHLSELLRVPFPLPGDTFISPDAGKIVKQISLKLTNLHSRLQKTFKELIKKAKRRSLFQDDEVNITKEWRKERKRQIDTLQSEFEPLIYQYFGLTDQEIALVEDTNSVFEPSSTPNTWNTPKTVTLDPVEKTAVEPYASQGLAAYADTLTQTLNSWAEAEGSNYRVRAKGGMDNKTGLAKVTVTLANSAESFHPQTISQELAEQLNSFHRIFAKDHGTLLYHRDIFLFQDKQIHIVRPNTLLNWTRTAALNDAARIYGDIVLAHEAK